MESLIMPPQRRPSPAPAARAYGTYDVRPTYFCAACETGMTGRPGYLFGIVYRVIVAVIIAICLFIVLFFTSTAAVSVKFLTFAFGVYGVYRLHRLGARCPCCGSRDLVPVTSPLGQRLSAPAPDLVTDA